MGAFNTNKLRSFLQSGVFNEKSNDTDEFINFIEKHKCKSISILYGETYDIFGLTIDSLKYYFTLEILTKLLKEMGIDAKPTVLIGDIASIRNQNVNKAQVLCQIRENLKIIHRINSQYKLSFEILKMSEIFQSTNFQNKLDKVKLEYTKNEQIQKILNKTVLENRLKQETESGFQYALEEVTIISSYDIKIGPPREYYYDQAAQQLSKGKPFGLYIKPTYPLGLNYDYFINHAEIEEFGITPYKAGSNKLQRNRVILNETTNNQLNQLITASFVPQFSELPNPVLDLLIISDLAKRVLEKNYDFQKLTYPLTKSLKRTALTQFTNQFHEYLK